MSPSKGPGLVKKNSKNDFQYFNGMKIRSSIPSTPIEKELPKEFSAIRGQMKMIALKKVNPGA